MVKLSTSKAFGTEKGQVQRVTAGIGETWTIVTTSTANEGTLTLQDDTYQVEVINLSLYDSSALSGNARVAITATETADAGTYIPLASAGSITIDVGAQTAIYYKRDAATDVTLAFRERRI